MGDRVTLRTVFPVFFPCKIRAKVAEPVLQGWHGMCKRQLCDLLVAQPLTATRSRVTRWI
jgi:hypothetical protein